MSSNLQKEAFLNYEANAWFERNKGVLENYSPEGDGVIQLLKNYQIKPGRILEIGCSGGYRLDGIGKSFDNVDLFGIEPSLEAIQYGQRKFSSVNFTQGTVDDMSAFDDAQFDVVIVGFVFYVVDRLLLLKAISEIDRVLANEGLLIIIDFFAEKANRNNYEHINSFEAFAYKQNYEELFTATKLYHLLHKNTLSHSTKAPDASNNYYDKYSVSLLKKDISAGYR